MRWLLTAFAHQDQTPSRRHWWWKSTLRLQNHDPGVEEHQFLSDIIETALGFDRLNVSELQCFEAVSRRFMLWEELYGEALRSSEGGATGSALADMDERSLFLGQKHGRGLALVCPALSEFVASQLTEKSSMLKERRKAREEHAGSPVTGAPASSDASAVTKPRGRRRGGRGKGEGGDG